VKMRPNSWPAVVVALSVCALLVSAQEDRNQSLNQEFQSAAAQYDAGEYAETTARLEKLLPYATKSFEVHELLGLCYAAQSQYTKAEEQLETAVRLNPKSAEVRTNLAASFAHAGKPEQAIAQLKTAIELEPKDYEATHNLGELYVQTGKLSEAVPFLEAAQRIQSASYDNGYDLAMALFLTAHYEEATQQAQRLLQQKNTAELHNLLGQINEKSGKYVDSANEFQLAAHMEPSDDNLFDWGSELLLHRTYDPAIEIFRQGTLRFPNSPRLMIGLGMALDLRGRYDEAVQALLKGADLDPADARCYLFLSKAYDNSPNQAEDVIQRFRRYAELEPRNGLAQYYYAMSLWKGKRLEDSDVDLHAVESLLRTAIALDEKLPEAHVQLGNLYADQREYDKSILEYLRALELDPNLPDAHYRLGQDYVHLGQKDKAQQEFAVYQKLRAQHLAEEDKERAEVQQFVYSDKSATANKP
jgi:tetratricopeptide (TPR) repeat protein